MSEQREERFVGMRRFQSEFGSCRQPRGEHWSTANDELEIPRLVDSLRQIGPKLIVVEATGGLQTLVVAELAAAGLPVAVIIPPSAGLCQGDGHLRRPTSSTLSCWRDLARQSNRRCENSRMRRPVTHRFDDQAAPDRGHAHGGEESAGHGAQGVRKEIKKHIEWLEARIEVMNGQMSDAIKQHPIWREKDSILRSTPGVGPVLSVSLLAGVPELGRLNRQKLAALVGVAPLNRDSGLFKGRRKVWGGRAQVRAVLYMATLARRGLTRSSALSISGSLQQGNRPRLFSRPV